MLLASLLLQSQAAATATSPPAAPPEVTVIGRDINVTAATLRNCLARACPPAEDIDASLAHAETQLVAGDLQGARSTLYAARGRNKRFAASLPVEVSKLLHFDADVAMLLGLGDYGRIATIDSVSALKAKLPADDPRVSVQRLFVGDVFMREGRHRAAVDIYDDVIKRAAASHWPVIQGAAMFRALTFYATAASVNPAYKAQARRRYAAVRATTAPQLQLMRDASVVLEARLALMADKHADVSGLMRKISGMRATEPLLVVEPLVELGSSLADGSVVTPAVAREQWADFSFRINADGTVGPVERSAQAPHANSRWIDLAQKAIAGRRYMPLALPSGSDGLWRRERVMIVADLAAPTGSRLRKQLGRPKLHSIDLSAPSIVPGSAPGNGA